METPSDSSKKGEEGVTTNPPEKTLASEPVTQEGVQDQISQLVGAIEPQSVSDPVSLPEITPKTEPSTQDDISSLLQSIETPKGEESVASASPAVSESASEEGASNQDDISALLQSIDPTKVEEKPEAPAPATQAEASTQDDISSILQSIEPPKGEETVVSASQAVSEIASEGGASSQEDISALLQSVELQKTDEVTSSVPESVMSDGGAEPKEEVKTSTSSEEVISSVTAPSLVKEKPKSEFDVSNDPDVLELKARLKEKSLEVATLFVKYKTFSLSFIKQLPSIAKRRKKLRLGLRDFSDWIEKERQKIQKIEDPSKKMILEKASVIFEQELHAVANKGKKWVRDGWSKAVLVILWMVLCVVAFGVGIPSLYKTYSKKILKPVVVQEIPVPDSLEAEPSDQTDPHEKVSQGYLLLSCQSSQVGVFGTIRVFDKEGNQVASFPHVLNPLKRKSLTPVPSGELGVVIQTEEESIVGTIELNPNQRRYIDLSRWTDPSSRAIVKIQTSPEGLPILCNGVPLGKSFSRVYLIAGSHKVWAGIPNFPTQDVSLIVADDQEQSVTVAVSMGRFLFKIAPEISKTNRNLKVFVNAVLVTNLNSYPVLSGHHLVKIMDSGRVILEQRVDLEPAEEVTFLVSKLEDGQLGAALISKKSALRR